jgi:hypothetical protein
MKMQRTRALRLAAAALAALLAFLATACATNPPACTEEGQILWQKGSNPERDAPRWIEGGRAAVRAAGVRNSEIPKRYLVYVGISEDRADERGAHFKAVEDMLKRYAVYLQQELDRVLPQAAAEAKLPLPPVNTALGAERAVSFLPREAVETGQVRETWQAIGERCPAGSQDRVYRIYVLGVFDRDARKAHLLEAAKETFKYAIIPRENQARIMEEAEKIVRRL